MNNTQKPQKIGVFIARFQPLHKAHLYVIEKALKKYNWHLRYVILNL